jgi:hypothetical protein
MRFLKTALATLGASALAVGMMAAPAMADTNMPLYGGQSDVTTTNAALTHLTTRGILMSGFDGATDVILHQGPAQQKFSFELTTPSNLMLEDDVVNPQKVGSVTGGRISHNGAIKFINVKNGKHLAVGDFIVNFNKDKVFATMLNGDPIDPLAVFNIVTVDNNLFPIYKPEGDPTTATLSGINLFMTGGAASALNEALDSHAFDAMKFGKIRTVADIVEPAM